MQIQSANCQSWSHLCKVCRPFEKLDIFLFHWICCCICAILHITSVLLLFLVLQRRKMFFMHLDTLSSWVSESKRDVLWSMQAIGWRLDCGRCAVSTCVCVGGLLGLAEGQLVHCKTCKTCPVFCRSRWSTLTQN